MQNDRWHLGLIVREAVRNVFGTGSRLSAILVLAVLVGAGSSAYIAVETQTMRQEVQDLAAGGRNTLVFASLNEGTPTHIERSSCEALAGQHGILRAGIIERAGELDVLPVGTRLNSQRASATLFPELRHVDLLVGRKLSDRELRPFTVRSGTELASAMLADTYPDGLGVGSSITLPLHPKETRGRECVVILDAFSDVDSALPTIASQLKVMTNPASATELLIATNNPVTAYLQRTERWFPLILGLLGAIATAITTRLRASEIAVYRMSGTSAISIMKLLTIEVLFIAGTASLAATAASLALSTYYLDPAIPILWGLALAGIWTITALTASLDLAIRRPTDLAKDR